MDECVAKGKSAGKGVARAACLSLVLRCPVEMDIVEAQGGPNLGQLPKILQGAGLMGNAE